MANMAVERIKREFKELERSQELSQCNIKLEVVNNNWTEFSGEIGGPSGTPYEGGKFVVEIKAPETYPFNPPMVRFVTPIWHPNVSSVTGTIAMDILHDKWAACMTLRTVMLSLQALLGAAQLNTPLDPVIARQCRKKHELFLMTAKHWTNIYAGGPHVLPTCNSKIERLIEMGIDVHDARVVLSRKNWHMEKAVDALFV